MFLNWHILPVGNARKIPVFWSVILVFLSNSMPLIFPYFAQIWLEMQCSAVGMFIAARSALTVRGFFSLVIGPQPQIITRHRNCLLASIAKNPVVLIRVCNRRQTVISGVYLQIWDNNIIIIMIKKIWPPVFCVIFFGIVMLLTSEPGISSTHVTNTLNVAFFFFIGMLSTCK